MTKSRRNAKSEVSNALAVFATMAGMTLVLSLAFYAGLFSINIGFLSNRGPSGILANSSSQSNSSASTAIITETITKTVKSTKTVYSIINGSSVEIVTMTLQGGTASNASQAGTAFLRVTLSNTNSSTFISGLTLSGGGLTKAINSWDNSSSPESKRNLIVFTSSHIGNNAIPGGDFNVTLGFYPTTKNNPIETIVSGTSFDYEIDLANGESLIGQITAQ
jgi:hypothetical protein